MFVSTYCCFNWENIINISKTMIIFTRASKIPISLWTLKGTRISISLGNVGSQKTPMYITIMQWGLSKDTCYIMKRGLLNKYFIFIMQRGFSRHLFYYSMEGSQTIPISLIIIMQWGLSEDTYFIIITVIKVLRRHLFHYHNVMKILKRHLFHYARKVLFHECHCLFNYTF